VSFSEKKAQKNKVDASNIRYAEKCQKRTKLHADIVKTEKDIADFISSCQKLYDNEIAEVS